MKGELCLLIGCAVAIAMVALSGAQMLAQAPPGQPDLRADPYYADYVDTLAYWFQYNYEDDWQTRLSEALIVAPDQNLEEKDDDDMQNEKPSWVRQIAGAEHVVLTGLPDNSWSIDNRGSPCQSSSAVRRLRRELL